MTSPVGAAPSPAPAAPSADEAKLRKTAQQLEGLFVEQLFKAMRETVPQEGGAVGTPQGEDMFTGLMDQRLATETPTQWAHGLADAAYRQLRTALPGAASTSDTQHPGALPNAAAKPVHAIPLTPAAAAAMALRAPEAIPVARGGPMSLSTPAVAVPR